MISIIMFIIIKIASKHRIYHCKVYHHSNYCTICFTHDKPIFKFNNVKIVFSFRL